MMNVLRETYLGIREIVYLPQKILQSGAFLFPLYVSNYGSLLGTLLTLGRNVFHVTF